MKTTSLPSVEEVVEKVYWEDQWDGSADEVQGLLTQDRNQAYTRLVAGIEGMTYAINVDEYLELVGKWDGKNYDQPFDDGYAQALKDIREKVVKPLYNKTGDN